MTSQQSKDFSAFDAPDVLNVVFHPRAERRSPSSGPSPFDLLVDIDEAVQIGIRCHPAGKNDPVIVFFHGNGEIASDYDDLGPLFTEHALNFIVCDYRGYGLSSGRPTISHMMNDCLILFDKILGWLRLNGYLGRIIVMGRSLGSASALEIASARPEAVDALIIESGFALIMPLLNLLGLYKTLPGLSEEGGPMNAEKIKTIDKPTLVIHAQFDHIIPFSDGQTLFNNAGAVDKQLLEIKGADHNTIFYRGLDDYMQAIQGLADKIR